MYREANHPTMPSPAIHLAPRLAAAILAALAAAALLAGPNAARAADLRIGYKAEISAADPHVLDAAGRNLWGHVYETLVGLDNKLRPVPLLATAWRQLDDRSWEFQLRAGVRFSNGEPFTAEDARYSIERALKLPGARTFRTNLKSVAEVEVTGPLTLRVRTRSPNPVLPQNVGMVAMLPRSLGANVREADFAHGSAAIGTGPYRLVAWEHGQQLTLSRNPDYWGGPQPWQRLVFQFIPKEPARASALLSGLVDVIDASSASIAEAIARTLKEMRPSQRHLLLRPEDQRGQPVMITEFGGLSLHPKGGKDWFGYVSAWASCSCRSAPWRSPPWRRNSAATAPRCLRSCATWARASAFRSSPLCCRPCCRSITQNLAMR